MRTKAWKSHEFVSSTPVLDRVPETKTINEMIADLERRFFDRDISESIFYTEMNKLYLTHIHTAGSINSNKMSDINKIKLHYAHLIIDGEHSKIDRRKKVLQHIVQQGY